MAINTNCPCTTGRASATHEGMPRAAPTMGRITCVIASSRARIRAKLPSSGIMMVNVI